MQISLEYGFSYKGYRVSPLSNGKCIVTHVDKFTSECDSRLLYRRYKSPHAAKIAITKHLKGGAS